MTDHEARFSADFGRSMNRVDWWNLKREHTPFQWQLQQAAYYASPIGERRADLRAAHNTLHLMLAMSTQPISDDDANTVVKCLRQYLKDSADYEAESTLQAVEILKRRQKEQHGEPR